MASYSLHEIRDWKNVVKNLPQYVMALFVKVKFHGKIHGFLSLPQTTEA